MYANPKPSVELRNKIRKIADQQSKLSRDSRKWAFLDMLRRELVTVWAELRVEKDYKALTYK